MAEQESATLPLRTELSLAAGLAQAAIALLTATSLNAALLDATGLGDAFELLPILVTTAPLALSVAILALLLSWKPCRTNPLAAGFMLVTVGPLLLNRAYWLGIRFGILGFRLEDQPPGLRTPSDSGLLDQALVLRDSIVRYYRAYGAETFWSSVIVGLLVAFAWWRIAVRLRAAAA